MICIGFQANGPGCVETSNDNLASFDIWRWTLGAATRLLVNQVQKTLDRSACTLDTWTSYTDNDFVNTRVNVQHARVAGANNVSVFQNHQLRFKSRYDGHRLVNRAQDRSRGYFLDNQRYFNLG
jgi:hypothetical protein